MALVLEGIDNMLVNWGNVYLLRAQEPLPALQISKLIIVNASQPRCYPFC